MANDLSLATVPELIDELQRRFTNTLFVAARPPKVAGDSDFLLYTVVYSGGYVGALGAARYADIYINTFVSELITQQAIEAQEAADEAAAEEGATDEDESEGPQNEC